ncbi:sodium:solute symporter family protein [Desulfoluna butyratoxydans]|uniref:Sodium/solute symporter n=1 Tax=Desulfoluna butyratoxydans TaxID=231438 RepID=A0A4U8YPS3_9BACT|nr:sodium:solute symporter family protein [Desulfoluna butyratoxydans]VFQ45714.1 sodium/solute symporter [Desulfoluna butyratoxydans]
MSHLDWAIVGGYLLFSVALGLYFSRRALKSVDDYFVSGRSFPWWLAGVSMVASAFAIDTPLGITGLVAENGIPGVWFAWSFVLGGAGTLGAFLFSAMLRRSRIITTAELIELRYSGPQAAVLRAFKGLYFGVFANAITLGWILKAVWTLSEVVVPGVNRDLLLFVLLLFTLIYTAMSGLWGIAATDFIQFVIGSVGSFLLAFYAWRYIGGIDQVVIGFTEKYGAADAGLRLSFLPEVGTPFFVTFVVFMTLKWWGNPPPAITQRIIASKNEQDASKATLFFAVLAFGFNYWPMIFAAMVSLIAFPDASSPETGYAMLLTTLLPSGMLGLMMASLMAAFMSTVDTHINYGASYMVNDIYRRFMVKEASETHYVRASQVSTVLMLLVSVVVAYNLDSVADAWYYMSMITAGYGIVIVIRWFWWRVNAWAEITALATSGITSTVLSPKFAQALGYWEAMPDIRWQYRFLIVVGICTVSWVVVCFLTEPDDEAHLVAFCERVRPFPAFWGPIYRRYPHLGWRPNFGRACLLWGMGAVGVYAFCFGVGSLMFLRYAQAGGLIFVAAVIAYLISRLWRP